MTFWLKDANDYHILNVFILWNIKTIHML